MTENYYQCCYTNAEVNTGGMVSSGWQTVAVNQDIPSNVLNSCVGMQSVNSTIQGPMVDEAGNVLDLYEIWADNTYVYTMRSKYGMVDRLGRPNMFSHAIVFNWENSDALYDPNVFLALDTANYKTNVEDAAALKPPLSRGERMDIDTALDEAKISPESYLTLIRCVYAKTTERALSQPVFVQYDGTERQMRLVLYCVYKGLPYFLRKALRVASVESNNAANRDLIFSINAHAKRCFVDPQTGENNVLNPRLERKIERYAFIDYAISRRKDAEREQYFKNLENAAKNLGDSRAADPLILKIAHLHIMGYNVADLTDTELEERISDALRSRPLGSQSMDTYIAELLNEVIKRNMVLTKESAACLAKKVASSLVKTLLQADTEYTIRRLLSLSPNEAARELDRLNEKKPKRYTDRLLQSDKGRQILDCYYADVVLSKAEPSWKEFNRVLDESKYLRAHPQTTKHIHELAYELYRESLNDLTRAAQDFESYSALIRRLDKPKDAAWRIASARDEYWQRVQFDTFDFSLMNDLPDNIQYDSKRADMFNGFAALLKELRNPIDDEDILFVVQQYFEKYDTYFDGEAERDKAVDVALELLDEVYAGGDQFILSWTEVVVDVPSVDGLELIMRMRRSLYEGHFTLLMNEYRELRKRSIGRNNEFIEDLLYSIAGLICEYCAYQEQQSSDWVTPLDTWLLVGEDLYQNPFDVFEDHSVFDERRAAILTMPESVEYALASELFASLRIRKAAEEYGRSKGRGAHVVRGWVNAANKRDHAAHKNRSRRQRKEQRVQRTRQPRAKQAPRVVQRPVREVPDDGFEGTLESRVPPVGEPEDTRQVTDQEPREIAQPDGAEESQETVVDKQDEEEPEALVPEPSCDFIKGLGDSIKSIKNIVGFVRSKFGAE